MAPWTPANLGSALKGWFYAPDIGQGDGTTVASWPDKSGNGRTLTQSTEANKPTYQTGELNGLAVVRYDGIDDFLHRTDSLGISAEPHSIYAVWLMANAANQILLHYESAADDPLVWINGSGNLETGATGVLAAAITKAAWRMTGNGFNGASSWLAIDGGTRVTGNPGNEPPNGTAVRMGRHVASTTQPLNGDVFTALVLNTAPGQAVEDKIFGWMAHTAGLTASLPANHPYKNAAPTVSGSNVLERLLWQGIERLLHRSPDPGSFTRYGERR